MNLKIPAHIKSLQPYVPGRSAEDSDCEGKEGCWAKMGSNENPWGPSPKVVRSLRGELTTQNRYPDSNATLLRGAIASQFDLSSEEVVLGNGSSELIECLTKVFVQEGDEVVTSHPSFLMYDQFTQIRGGVNRIVPLGRSSHDLKSILDEVNERTRLVFIDNPNNPTGSIIAPPEMYQFLSDLPEHVVAVIDEAYIDYTGEEQRVDIFSLIRNTEGRCGVVFLRTFSKMFGMAGLRIGYGVMPKEIAGFISRVRQPFSVCSMAQAAAAIALQDTSYYDNITRITFEAKDILVREIEKLGCVCLPSAANFFLVDIKGDCIALANALYKKKVIVRPMSAYGFPNHIRVTVGTDQENIQFIEALSETMTELGYN